jgi:hypothetical protein
MTEVDASLQKLFHRNRDRQVNPPFSLKLPDLNSDEKKDRSEFPRPCRIKREWRNRTASD